jgi:hypothetical protein
MLHDALSEGIETKGGQSPAVDPIVTAMSGFNGPDLVGSDQEAIKAAFMSYFAAYAKALVGTEWVDLPFSAGWSQWGDPNHHNAQYKRTGLGVVKLRGRCRKSAPIAGWSSIGFLPFGFRPSKAYIFSARSHSVNAEIIIYADGNIVASQGAFQAAETWWSLDGIEFEVG